MLILRYSSTKCVGLVCTLLLIIGIWTIERIENIDNLHNCILNMTCCFNKGSCKENVSEYRRTSKHYSFVGNEVIGLSPDQSAPSILNDVFKGVKLINL